MLGRILLIVHQEHSDPGRIGHMLARRGYELDLRRVGCGHALPETLEEHAAAIIFGGPMSANDGKTLEFIKAELDWLDIPMKEDKPFLGVCLGAQLLARYLGAQVGPHDEGWHEIGYYKVRATEAGREFFADEQHFYQWHGEGFEVPAGTELLATGEYFENQAFRYGRSYAIQFHPEVTYEMMLRWTGKAVHRMVLPAAQSRDTHLEGHRRYDSGVEAWLEKFLEAWLRPVEGRAERAVPEPLPIQAVAGAD